ncbi:hypothetical protein SBO82_13355 [Alcaligenes nematophilus]|uniref:hypothetical protein n=1 Tax=Alcaligenes nematophilus TaxID=2994643 RepID=UPI00245BA3AE|nr:hypothetical protein [Alcaligenes nematophilus]MDH4867951.1 hypothetical protein [Bacillus cereus]MDY7129262.1 hypothetical protein [Alcaligenes nematophilus]
MKTVEEVRRIRLKMLIKEVGGTAADLNRATGKNDRDSTYSQILNQSLGSKTGKPKQMGSPLARALEEACGKPLGWMDTDPDLSNDAWPFSAIPKSKLLTLERADVIRLESAMRVAAKNLGLEIED